MLTAQREYKLMCEVWAKQSAALNMTKKKSKSKVNNIIKESSTLSQSPNSVAQLHQYESYGNHQSFYDSPSINYQFKAPNNAPSLLSLNDSWCRDNDNYDKTFITDSGQKVLFMEGVVNAPERRILGDYMFMME